MKRLYRFNYNTHKMNYYHKRNKNLIYLYIFAYEK